ncbi:benzoate 4-monooxygenase cytochrome P450 [Stachybotrys elegans]|uniref:Benzoate 4-monooxygenase cytochrome P450 n=1 Tax=Stachybotrys elegans TaxID=80388 RepID=A0A8K0T221_9HYPO|nr:benzoate 4-monooxygenase cytochrome P450 [Stachybotrys elegans]
MAKCLRDFRAKRVETLAKTLAKTLAETLADWTGWYLGFYDLTSHRNDKILDWHRKYGPVVCIGPNEVSVATLDGTRKIYGTTFRWAKSNYFDHFKGYGMRSVFATKEYEEHRQKRRFISSFYQPSTIYKLPEIEHYVKDRAEAVVRQIQHDQPVDVYGLTDWYAIDIITFLTLGPDFASQSIESPCVERQIFARLKQQQFVGPFRIRHPRAYAAFSRAYQWLSSKRSYLVADDDLASWCKDRISAAMDGKRLLDSHSLLRHLLHHDHTGTENAPLNRDYVAAEILDNINAAEATVAVTATYLLWRLTAAPLWQDNIRKELALLPVQEDGSLSFTDIDSRVPALEACLREVYRLHPASSGRAERVVPQGGSVISDFHLPEDTIVTTSVPALHRDEVLFPDPDRFMPERWLNADPDTLKAREAQLIPFGHGGRICLGKALATLEIKVLIASLYQQHKSVMEASTTAESMRQCSTHDAVPSALKCEIRFQRVAEKC